MNLPGTPVADVLCKGREMPSGNYELFAFTETDPDGAWALKDYPSGVIHFRYVCPCGCRGFGELPLTRATNPNPHTWDWDGNREAPTVSPSIYRRLACGWHGFFRAGVWEGV